MTHSRLPVVLTMLLSIAFWSAAARAQDTVIQVENVRIDYAQVLQVEPVFQTLTATQIQQQCEGASQGQDSAPDGLSRIVGKVRQALRANPATVPASNCRQVPVKREFRRPIAYDVDYIYKGMKYRSRLPNDPGNRLRVRVSVTPYVTPAER